MKRTKSLRIVVTGAHGMLGRDCMEVLGTHHHVVPLTRAQLDFADGPRSMERLAEIHPEVIVNCAAYTDVDGCETHIEKARTSNVRVPLWLADASRQLRASFVHISTDYVFDGQRPPPQPYVEDDPPAPLNVYGQSKWEGEEAVRSRTPNHLIVRTGWLYGRHGRSFPRAILRQAIQGSALSVVNDQFGSPTWSRSLARQIRILIEASIYGTVHATAQGYCSWFEFADAFLKEMGIAAEIHPCATSEYPRPARRPVNSILDNRRLHLLGLECMPQWQEDLEGFVWEHGEALCKDVQRETR